MRSGCRETAGLQVEHTDMSRVTQHANLAELYILVVFFVHLLQYFLILLGFRNVCAFEKSPGHHATCLGACMPMKRLA